MEKIESGNKAGLSEIEANFVAKSLMLNVNAISPENTNIEVTNYFRDNSGVIGLPVVENNKPIGLINRNIFMDSMARPFHAELYNRKSCISFMDKTPLVVPEDMSIQELSFKVVNSGSKTLNDGFIITDHEGIYLGIGTGEDLVRVVTHLQAEKNRLVMESINYASVIQKSFLRNSMEDLQSSLKEFYLHWEPRDKVGGDYYYCKKFDDGFFLALIDCTGHGVPGAFMTLIMSSFLDHMLIENNKSDPAGLMQIMNKKVKDALGQHDNTEGLEGEAKYAKMLDKDGSDDGMDAAFIWVDLKNKNFTFSGAKTPLYMLNPGDSEVAIIDGDKKGVGYVDTPYEFEWTNKTSQFSEGMNIYMTTDGVIDQIGGSKNIAFGKKRYTANIIENSKKTMTEQKDLLLKEFYDYQGKQKRRDDVTIAAFKL